MQEQDAMFSWSDDRIDRVARAICAEAHYRRHGFLPAAGTVARELPAYLPLARVAVLALHDPAELDALHARREAQAAELLGESLPA